MALKGNFKHWANHTDEFTTKEVTVEHPTDYPKENPNYEKRGTTETVEIQEPVLTSKTYKNSYVNIRQVTVNRKFVYKTETEKVKIFEIHYTICVYAKENDYKNEIPPIIEQPTAHALYEGDHNNIFSDAYNHLKALKGFEEMVDDI